jgi:methanogenic corrinoid protein MtbC1
MAQMTPQPRTEESWTEAEAMRLIRALSGGGKRSSREPNENAQRRHDVLLRTVEDEVIPRLLMARRPQRATRAAAQPDQERQAQIEHLVRLVLDADQAKASTYVEALHDGGMSLDVLFLDLLTPVALRLGEMWEDDTCTFSDVTIGMLRLGNVLRLLSRAFSGDFEPKASLPSILLVQMPGEQHGFGLAMVTQFFRRAGWNVHQQPMVTSADLVRLVRTNWYGVIGISVACSERLELLAADIRAIRTHSRNRAIGVMVGGPPFIVHPQLASIVGADRTAADGATAVRQAQSLVSLLARDQ